MADQLPPASDEAEIAVLGAVLLAPSALTVITADVRLRPDHFYHLRHQRIWRAMLAVSAAGGDVDAVTVSNQLAATAEPDHPFDEAQRGYVFSLAGAVPVAAHVTSYARIVLEKAQWRQRLRAGRDMTDAALNEDPDAFARAEARLVHSDEAERRTSYPEDLAERLYAMLEEAEPEAFPWPFRRLNEITLGGMRRGQLTLVPAWTSHGKSVFIDQALGYVAEPPRGYRSHLYFNEGTEDERIVRLAARMARVPASRIATRQLTSGDRGRIASAMERIPFGMTDCTGWLAEDVVRDMVHKRWDVVGIDGLGRFPGARRREEIEEISRLFNEAVRPSRANCHVLLAHHLNRSQVTGTSAALPFPQLGSIRDSAKLADDADNVLFVFRDQDEDVGEPLASGMLRFAKVRSPGRPGGMQVTFEGEFQRFEAGAFNADRWHGQAAGAVPA